MPRFDENGLFAGLSPDDKATAVLAHLSIDEPVTLQELMNATGLSAGQIHTGIRHLREAKPHCVITLRRGAASAYKLAENAPEVRDYAIKRMQHWRTQIQIVHTEMQTAQNLLPDGDRIKVKLATEQIMSLLRILELSEAMDKDFAKREQVLARQARKISRRK